MVSRRTRVASWILRRDHPSRPRAMICCFFSSFKTFAMSREAIDSPAAVNVLDVSSENMAAFQVFFYGRFWVFTEAVATHEQLKRIEKIPKREFMRRGINQHTLEKICKREPVRSCARVNSRVA